MTNAAMTSAALACMLAAFNCDARNISNKNKNGLNEVHDDARQDTTMSCFVCCCMEERVYIGRTSQLRPFAFALSYPGVLSDCLSSE